MAEDIKPMMEARIDWIRQGAEVQMKTSDPTVTFANPSYVDLAAILHKIDQLELKVDMELFGDR